MFKSLRILSLLAAAMSSVPAMAACSNTNGPSSGWVTDPFKLIKAQGIAYYNSTAQYPNAVFISPEGFQMLIDGDAANNEYTLGPVLTETSAQPYIRSFVMNYGTVQVSGFVRVAVDGGWYADGCGLLHVTRLVDTVNYPYFYPQP